MDGFQPGNIRLGLFRAQGLLFPGRSCGCRSSSDLARVANSASRPKSSTCSIARISAARMASSAAAAIRTSASPTAWPGRRAAFQFGAAFTLLTFPPARAVGRRRGSITGGRKVGASVMLTRRELGGIGAALSARRDGRLCACPSARRSGPSASSMSTTSSGARSNGSGIPPIRPTGWSPTAGRRKASARSPRSASR